MRFKARSHRRVAGAVVVILMAVVAVHAQIPSASQAGRSGQPGQIGQVAQPPPSTSSPNGIIRGHITAVATGKPLARVRVSLVSAATGAFLRLGASSSSVSGVFEVKDVPPGQYRVSAVRPGYLTLQWGQQHAREQGRALEVKAGQTVDRIDVALPKGGVMAGQITDELGQPYPGVRVDAMELRYFQGAPRRTPFPSGGATTDDRGQFRISDLPPGLYYLTASSSERWIGNDRQTYGYGTAYYPGVRSDQAQPITLGVSQERMDLNFRLAVSRTVRIAGRAQTASGDPVSIESVSIARSVGSGAIAVGAVATPRFGRDGTFDIPDVNTGDYRISVRGRSSAGPETGALTLKVGDAPLEGLLVVSRASTGSNVNGVLVTDENTPVPFAPVALRVNIIPGADEDVLSSLRVFNVAADSSFRLTAIGGAFYFRLLGLPEGWMVKSVRMNDDDITEVPCRRARFREGS